MTLRTEILAGAAALAVLATPLATTAQSQSGGAAALPEEISGLDLTNVRDETDRDGEREIRGFLPDGYRFEAEYDSRGRIEELRTERASELPQSLLESVLPGEVLQAITSRAMIDRIYEVDFDRDDSEIKVEGTGENSEIEVTFSMTGQMLEFDREMTDDPRREDFDLSEAEVRRIAERAGYTDIGTPSYSDERATFDATNPDGEAVTVSMDDDGDVTREAAR